MSHDMSILAANLLSRRQELGLSVPDIVAELNRRGLDLAYSTVAAWFNGGRRPREMEHLKALCEVLQTTISQMAGEDPEFAQNAIESAALSKLRGLEPAQREAILAIMETMAPRRA